MKLCACGCGAPVRHAGRYLETACRVRAYRDRKRRELRPLPKVFLRSCVTAADVTQGNETAGRYTRSRNELQEETPGARVLPVEIERAATFAYADPPYPGCAGLYADQPYTCEVNLPVLLGTLCREYPDGWALSTGGRHVQEVLRMCPDGVHVGVWTKPGFQRPAFRHRCWEPVIFCGGRWRRDLEVRDTVDEAPPSIPGFVGAKPQAFAFWLFAMLGARRGDALDDLFPGTGAIGRAWRRYQLEDETEDDNV